MSISTQRYRPVTRSNMARCAGESMYPHLWDKLLVAYNAAIDPGCTKSYVYPISGGESGIPNLAALNPDLTHDIYGDVARRGAQLYANADITPVGGPYGRSWPLGTGYVLTNTPTTVLGTASSTRDLTVCVRYYRTQVNPNGDGICWFGTTNATPLFAMSIGSGSYSDGYFYVNSVNNTGDTFPCPVNEWAHYTLRVDCLAGKAHAFVNGIKRSTYSFAGAYSNSGQWAGRFYLGGAYWGTAEGNYAEAYMWSGRALSDSEIMLLSRDGLAPFRRKRRTSVRVPAVGGSFQPAWAVRARQGQTIGSGIN